MIVTWRRLLVFLAVGCSLVVCVFYSELRDRRIAYNYASAGQPNEDNTIRDLHLQVVRSRRLTDLGKSFATDHLHKKENEAKALYQEGKRIAASPDIGSSVPSAVLENINSIPQKPMPTDLSILMKNGHVQLKKEVEYDHSTLNNSVIIYAKCRTGSSFAGEFFNKNDKFFYTFEPIQMLTKAVRPDPHEWLGKTLSCQLEDLWEMGKANPIHNKKSLPGWKRKIFCYKLGMSHRCGNMSMTAIEEKCRKYKYTATKVILVQTLTKLLPLMERGAKVIQLVRDPRGVMGSRLKIYSGPNKTNSYEFLMKHWSIFHSYVSDYCTQIRDDMNTIRRLVLDYSTRGTLEQIPYVLVRYEDLAMRPFVEVNRMYKPLDIEPDTFVLNWIRDFTVRDSMRGEREETSFGTYRLNSTETAFNWREYIPWKFVTMIQDECADIMFVLGYPLFEKEADLADPNFSVLKQFTATRRT